MVLDMEDVISLAVGEPDFVTPWHIIEGCMYSLENGYTSYTSNWGILELRELISEYIKSKRGLRYNPESEILITTGVSEGLDLAIRATVNPGEEVLVIEPCYVAYSPCILFADGIPVHISTKPENEFKPAPEDIEGKISDKTKAIILGYPNNPTGSTMNRKEMEEIADIVIEHDILVISDEIYGELTYEGEHTSFASLNGMRDRTIVLNGFSKSHAMTGWRIGFATGNEEFIESMMKVHQYTMLCSPIMAQFAAIEAIKNGVENVEEMKSEYNRRRLLIVEGFNKMGLACSKPKGAFYAFPSIKETGLSSEEFSERLLKKEGVACVPGDVFGASGEGFVRCSYAVSRDALKEALRRIESFVEGEI
ncbi:MAG: aminotransferase class I/II-fold pyridoxal phosphate-dependent enzyme [Halobacteriota archaeon]|nr:aminotransferase class I/II-fold pyridoxal phosphate-dependent enzyme [Halobacteriota archaeon]